MEKFKRTLNISSYTFRY